MHNVLSTKYSNITSIPARRQAFVDDILGFYNNSNRSMVGYGVCIYSKTNASPGCAIGRCLAHELAKKLDNYQNPEIEDTSILSLFSVGLETALPKWMTEMGVDFLSACQSLHDRNYFWNNLGPTEEAINFVNERIKPLIES